MANTSRLMAVSLEMVLEESSRLDSPILGVMSPLLTQVQTQPHAGFDKHVKLQSRRRAVSNQGRRMLMLITELQSVYVSLVCYSCAMTPPQWCC